MFNRVDIVAAVIAAEVALSLAWVGCGGEDGGARLVQAPAVAAADRGPDSLAEGYARSLAAEPGSRAWLAASGWLIQHPDHGHDVLVRHLEARRHGWRDIPPLLARMGRPEGVAPLVGALYDEDHSLSWAAGGALGLHPDPSAADALIAAIGAPDAAVAKAAIEGLRVRRDPATCADLLDGLDHDAGVVRYHALRTGAELGCLGRARLSELADDDNPAVRHLARDLAERSFVAELDDDR